MHRNDWLPEATFIGESRGDQPYGAVLASLCGGAVQKTSNVHWLSKSPKGRAVLDQVKPKWRELRFPEVLQIEWYEPCRFVHGHPGRCATELPDIFDENGKVRPAIAKIMERSRRNAATDHGNDTDP